LVNLASIRGPRRKDTLLRGLEKINYTNKLACDDCAIRSRCTNGRFRTVSRMENEAVLDRMQARLAERPDVLDRRRETVEHPFGTIKQWMNQGTFLMRGLEKVRAEFSLTALAYNLRRVLNIVGFADLMAAVAAWKAHACRFCRADRHARPKPRRRTGVFRPASSAVHQRPAVRFRRSNSPTL